MGETKTTGRWSRYEQLLTQPGVRAISTRVQEADRALLRAALAGDASAPDILLGGGADVNAVDSVSPCNLPVRPRAARNATAPCGKKIPGWPTFQCRRTLAARPDSAGPSCCAWSYNRCTLAAGPGRRHRGAREGECGRPTASPTIACPVAPQPTLVHRLAHLAAAGGRGPATAVGEPRHALGISPRRRALRCRTPPPLLRTDTQHCSILHSKGATRWWSCC